MRLFTKEDVLDGDEKPVSPLTRQQECFPECPPLAPLPRGAGGTRLPLPVPSTLSLSDVLSLPSPETLYQEVLHPEVPKDLGAPYPFIVRRLGPDCMSGFSFPHPLGKKLGSPFIVYLYLETHLMVSGAYSWLCTREPVLAVLRGLYATLGIEPQVLATCKG